MSSAYKLFKLGLRAAFAAGLLAVALSLYTDDQAGVMPWPGNQIKIYDQTGRPQAMQKAARLWNQTGLNLKVSLVKTPEEADVIARGVDRFGSGCAGKNTLGCASVGKVSWPPWRKPRLEIKKPQPGEQDTGELYVRVAAHEIGHLWGLKHTAEKCTLMSTKGGCHGEYQQLAYSADCLFKNDEALMCPGTLIRVQQCGPSYQEVERLALRYGGRRNPNYRSFCQTRREVNWGMWCKTSKATERKPKNKECVHERSGAGLLAAGYLSGQLVDRLARIGRLAHRIRPQG